MLLETEQEIAFRETCRRFAEREIRPLVDGAEQSGKFPKVLLEKAAAAGLLAITAAEEHGGAGAGLIYQCILVEESARVCAGLGTGFISLGNRLLPRVGTAAQIERYYLPLLRGEKTAAFAMTEPDAGSDVLAMRGTAERSNGGWRIRASKMYITGAPFSDYMLVVVYTDKKARRGGLSVFLVDSDLPGIEIRKLDKLGHRSMETGAVFFDCEAPDQALIGEPGRGMDYVMSVLEDGRILHAARSLGVARAALEDAESYARLRTTFGKSINQYQAIQHKLAHMLIEVSNAQLQVRQAALKFDAGLPCQLDASVAKVVASEAAVSVTDQAMRIVAGAGYLNELPIQRYFRDARLYPITEGTTEIQLRNIARIAGFA
ncbi:MAG: acyl-CoA dehydrogenase domain protein [Alphaproteobacteria bacterium]|jgi:alkylation response protein AidB-like acyl-CoA dehydrogenase|nr:acyl-CoA dehydrogenase domain protein [Alphaproteobacteria bacterium]